MRATAMNAATVTLVLCLAISIVGESCIPKPKPRYNCAKGPTGILFPHPLDCTILIVCVDTIDIAVTLCDDQNYINAYDPGHAIGCRNQCPNYITTEEPCSDTLSTKPLLTEQLSTESSSNKPEHNESTSTEPTRITPVQNVSSVTESLINKPDQNESTSTEPSSVENASTVISEDQPSTTKAWRAPDHHDCISSGVFKHPTDCSKAYFCPSAGAHPVEVDVCAESSKDPNFLQGCFGDCQF